MRDTQINVCYELVIARGGSGGREGEAQGVGASGGVGIHHPSRILRASIPTGMNRQQVNKLS